MKNAIKIKDDLYWIGANDRRIHLFENIHPVPEGMSYNSYIVLDDKNTVIDGIDTAVVSQYIENIKEVLGDKQLDYAIINHVEPDHCAGLLELFNLYPYIKFIGNTKTINLVRQFYPQISLNSFITVKEKDTFSTGKHQFEFYFAPMVHWPEVMNTYCSTLNVLFSADAFGSFGALNGNLYQDQIYNKNNLINETRRYYSNIVGKYGIQTNSLIKKVSNLSFDTICSLHGPLWRNESIPEIISLYKHWASYEAEEKSVCIVYGSIYGGTQLFAEQLAQKLSNLGVNNISIYDSSNTHFSYILSEMFRCSHIILLSCTYNNGLFPPMENILLGMKAHNISNRSISIIENGSWAPQAAKIMKQHIEELKNIDIIEPYITIKSRPTNENNLALTILAENIHKSLR